MRTTMVSVVVMKVVVVVEEVVVVVVEEVVVEVPPLPDAVSSLQGRHPLLALGPLHRAV